MISKPIKLTDFWLKFTALNQSVTLASCLGREEQKIFIMTYFTRVNNSYNHFQVESMCMTWKTLAINLFL